MTAHLNFYPCLPDEQRDHAIERLERTTRSLDRGDRATLLAADYRRALDHAHPERAARST